MNYKDICVIIPAYNEEKSIKGVIESIFKVSQNLNVVVVNDGSKDATSKEARRTRAIVLELPFNLGIGGAVQTGLIFARENKFEKAVQIDADGQHDPRFLPALLKNLDEKTDMVIGSRFIKRSDYKPPLLRFLGIKLFSYLIDLTCGKKVYDSTSGFRVFGKKAIIFFADNYPQDFPEPKSLVSFLRAGYNVKEVSVDMKQRTTGVSSVNSFFKATYLMLSISISILVEAFKSKKSYV